MTEWKRRTRVVSFRLSEEEHQELTSYCAREGVRSLSDFARLATFIQFESRSISEPDTALQQIYRRLAALDREVQRLTRLVEGPGEDEAPRVTVVAEDEETQPDEEAKFSAA